MKDRTADDELHLTLETQDGSEIDCIVMSIFPLKDRQYIALLPAEEADSEDGDIFLYGYSEDADSTPQLRDLEDDDEFEAVCARFEEVSEEEDYTELTADGVRRD